MARLVVQDRTGERTVELEKDLYVVGRASESDIQIRDQMSSRRHCQVERDAGGWKVVDLGSSNGTNVSGQLINQHVLSTGDEIQIGDARLRFEDGKKGATRKDRASTRRKSDSSPGDEEEDRKRTTRKRRAIRRGPGIPAPVVVGGVVIALVLVVAVVVSRLGGEDPDVANTRILSEARQLLEEGDVEGAKAKLDQVKSPGAKVKDAVEELKADLKTRRLERDAGEQWALVDRMAESDAASLATKIKAVEGFVQAFGDSTYAGTAKTALSRLEHLARSLAQPGPDPVAEARERASSLLERFRFGEAEQVWVEFRQEHPLKAETADAERSKVQEKARSEYDRLVAEARRAKEGGDLEEARRTIERIVENFGIQSHVDAARRLLREEFGE